MSKVFEEKDCLEEYKRLLNSEQNFDIETYQNLIQSMIQENKIMESYKLAIKVGNIAVVELLIENNININIQNDDLSPLHQAIGSRLPVRKEIVELLINNKADINNCSENTDITPLYLTGDIDIAELLISNHADINKPSKTGNNKLHKSVIELYKEMITLLLSNKADIDYPGFHQETPLFKACERGNLDVVELLINNQADLNKSNYKKQTPLHISLLRKNKDIAKLLIVNKCDPLCQNEYGETGLCLAKRLLFKDIVKEINSLLMDK